jgi:RNA polymerase sigma factor (sigma-70 family)
MNDDAPLLQEYVESGSEQAFGELVSRHIDVVYSAALRVGGGDAHLAEDVAQLVFTDLARKAGRLPRGVVLAGWLYRHSYFTACKAVRAERRRKAREQIAVEMSSAEHQPEATWDEIAPILDEAVNGLAPGDQEAIVLRFFHKRDFRSIGMELGISEDTAQKRVSRALEKLQVILKGHRPVLTTAALGAALATGGTVAAPAGLAVSITGASLAAAATGGTLTLMNYMAASKLKAAIIAATIVASVATPLLITRQALRETRQRNSALQELAREVETLRAENKRLSGIEVRAEELERLRKERAELLRLRGQAALAKTLADELARLKTRAQPESRETAAAGPRIPAADLKDAGLGTPEASAQTLMWATVTRNEERFKEVVDVEKFTRALHELRHKVEPDFNESEPHDDTFSISLKDMKEQEADIDSIQILSRRFPSPDEAELEVAATDTKGNTATNKFRFFQTDDEWKLDILAIADPDSFNFTRTETQDDGSETTNRIKVAVQDQKVLKLAPSEVK